MASANGGRDDGVLVVVVALDGLIHHVGDMEEPTSRRICSLIAGVICSDEKMSPDERSFLLRTADKFGLPRDIALMPITEKDDVAAELGQLSEALRWETLDLLIKAAAADGKIVEAEREILGVVTGMLGLSKGDLEERLRRELAGE